MDCTSINKTVCPDPVWKPVRHDFTPRMYSLQRCC